MTSASTRYYTTPIYNWAEIVIINKIHGQDFFPSIKAGLEGYLFNRAKGAVHRRLRSVLSLYVLAFSFPRSSDSVLDEEQRKGSNVVANLRRWSPHVRDRGPEAHLLRHHRPRRQHLGSELLFPSGIASILFSLCFDLHLDVIIAIWDNGRVEYVSAFSLVVISRDGSCFWFAFIRWFRLLPWHRWLFCDYDGISHCVKILVVVSCWCCFHSFFNLYFEHSFMLMYRI